jgi:tetratricopeptide (TPR) repeat protein
MNNSDKKKFSDFLNSGKFNEARLLLLPIYNKNRDDYEINYHFGLLYRASGQIEYAKHFLKRAVEINSDDTLARYSLGIVYQLEGNFQKSVQLLKKVLEIDPLFYSGYNSLGLTFKKNNKHKPALENYLLAQSTYIKKIILDLNKHPESIENIKFVPANSKSSYWYETIIGNLRHIAALDGMENIDMPTPEAVESMLKDRKLETYPWEDIGKNRFINFLVFDLVYNKLISDTFYCTICFNIGNLLIELEKYEDAKKWLNESIEFIPADYEYSEPFKALDFIESLE